MDSGDHGTARTVVVGTTCALLLAALVAGGVLHTGEADSGSPAAVPSVTASPPSGTPSDGLSGTPSALPSLLARPAIRPEQAFPQRGVRLADGSRYDRVDLVTTTDCARAVSPGLASLLDRGEGCARLTAALFTDVERRSRVTVTVLSMRRVEDASTVFAMASLDPVTYRVVSLDPPPEAGMPTAPPGSARVFRRLMTVRSVVFANGQWGDGSEGDEAAITRQTEGLLQYVNDGVAAYEEGGGHESAGGG